LIINQLDLTKLFSSVFIVLVLLNVVGYYGILSAIKYKNAQDLMSQFDAGLYQPDDTEVLKVPFKISKLLSSEAYQRVDGDFVRDGQVYRLIKQRLYCDTFHIVYIKDKAGTVINKVISDYVKTFSDTTGDDGNSFLLPVFLREYFVDSFSIEQANPGWQQAIHKAGLQQSFIDDYFASIIQPPERG
jgi:hypothetical protein